MIMTIEEVRNFLQTDESDSMLMVKLSALESLIRSYTNNNFQCRGFRIEADVSEECNKFTSQWMIPFREGDTVMITESDFSNGALLVVESVGENYFTADKSVVYEPNILVTRVDYPIDVKIGAVNLLKWELENRSKVGVASETISRHSVTYFNMDGDNSVMGFPKSLLGFLKPYMKARF